MREHHAMVDDMILITGELTDVAPHQQRCTNYGIEAREAMPIFVDPGVRSVDPLGQSPVLMKRWLRDRSVDNWTSVGMRVPVDFMISDDAYNSTTKPLALEPFIRTKSKYGRKPKNEKLDRNGRARAKVLSRVSN